MSIEDRDAFVASRPNNAAVLRPYIGGEDVNSRPDASFSRYMIDFSTKTLEEAAQWPELLERIEELVKPARMTDKRGTYKTYWWRPGESGGALYQALAGLDRCLCTANVTKHLMLTFQPTTPFFSQTLYVFPLDRWSGFAVLQSRVHEVWARLLSSSMKTDLRYTASDCFETFPFPEPDPRAVIPALEAIGEQLYQARANYMVDTDQGLTKTYNALKDPSESDPRILDLRELHEEMDRAVLAAYGWQDIPVPPFCPATDEDRAALTAFEDEVIDRLYLLNATRAREEARLGLTNRKPAMKSVTRLNRKSFKTNERDQQAKLFDM